MLELIINKGASMPIKTSNREQIMLFPPSIEDYVGENDVVRAYDAFVEHLNWEKLEIEACSNMGRPKYDPKIMLKLMLYSYSYGIRSSRRIEQACYHNLSFIWLSKGLKPDHKTISEFRRNNKPALKSALHQCVQFCIKTNLIEGNILFVDGTKIRANASIKNTYNDKKCQKIIKKIDHRIEKLLNECDRIDKKEQDWASINQLTGELADAKNLKEKVQKIMQELKDEKLISKNIVDPDCANMRSTQGSHASYNVQNVVDDKNKLIVSTQVVKDANDSHQFSNQINQANEQLKKPCHTACADAGYANTEELSKIDEAGIKVVVPSQKQALHKEPKPFQKDAFKYNAQMDCYTCPEGHTLRYRGFSKQKNVRIYKIAQPKNCRLCHHFGQCTKSKEGRKVTRLVTEEIKERLEKQYLDNQDIYKRRKETVEHPFGHYKRNLGIQSFLLRSNDSVQAEASVFATNFNLRRMVTLFKGVNKLVNAFAH